MVQITPVDHNDKQVVLAQTTVITNTKCFHQTCSPLALVYVRQRFGIRLAVTNPVTLSSLNRSTVFKNLRNALTIQSINKLHLQISILPFRFINQI